MNSTGSTQLGTSPRGGQPPRQGLPQQAGDVQLPAPLQPPSAQRDFLEQKIIAALRQLLPVSESDAVAVTPAFEAELDVRVSSACLQPLLQARCFVCELFPCQGEDTCMLGSAGLVSMASCHA